MLHLRERVCVSIHQDYGSCIIVPFLDCDTVGSEWIDQEEVRTVYECKDKTNNALLHEAPRQISDRLFTRAMRRCAHENSVATGQLV